MDDKFHDHGNLDLLEHMPDASRAEKVSATFSMICDGTRLRILWLLCHSEECVTNISKAINMSAPAVSHHLRILKAGNLIVGRRVGKETYYTLSGTDEAKLVHRMIDDIFEMKCNIVF